RRSCDTSPLGDPASILPLGLPLGEGLLLGVAERADADVADDAGGLVGGDAERLAGVALDADGDAPVAGGQIDHLVGVDPGLDAAGADADADAVPLAGLQLAGGARLVLRGVLAVDAGQADQLAAPAADHQRAEAVADGEGGGGEEVVADELLR